MKTLIIKISLAIYLAISLSSCLNEVSNDNDIMLDVPTNEAAKKNLKEYKINILAVDSNNLPFSGIEVSFFNQNPLNEVGNLKDDIVINKTRIYSGTTNDGGMLSGISVANEIENVYVLVTHLGVSYILNVKVINNEINIQIDGNFLESNTRIVRK